MNQIPYWVNENRGQIWQDECIELRRQVRELRERVKRLEDVGDRMAVYAHKDDAKEWEQAKEAA